MLSVTTLVAEALTQRERQQKEKPEAKRRASGLGSWESHLYVGIWFRFWALFLIGFLIEPLSLIGCLNLYPGATVDIWCNDDSYWLSICRHRSNMEILYLHPFPLLSAVLLSPRSPRGLYFRGGTARSLILRWTDVTVAQRPSRCLDCIRFSIIR